MAFDPNEHVLDPATGFHRHKVTGHLVGIEQAPPAKHPNDGGEFPKWVQPHQGHVKYDPVHGTPTTPGFPDFHVVRGTNEVHVLVHNEDDESRAMAAPV
jgi:hypothetical protein